MAGVTGLEVFLKESLEHREVKPPITGPQCSLLEKPKVDPDRRSLAGVSIRTLILIHPPEAVSEEGINYIRRPRIRKENTFSFSLKFIHVPKLYDASFCKKSGSTHKNQRERGPLQGEK